MNTRRRLVLWATSTAVAFFALALPALPVAATTPPPVAPAPTVPGDTAPVDPTQPEIVESWALAPGGSLDTEEAGNRPELSYVSDPGLVIEDSVILFNLGNTQQTFRVYATDAFNNDAGQFDLLPGDEVPTDAGSWVKVEQEFVTVPAGRQVQIPITITIPADATQGDHAGAVLASSETLGTGDAGDMVTLDRRTGTRMYIRVSGTLSLELAVTNVDSAYNYSVNPLGGSADVSFKVRNVGNVRLGGTGSVSVAGPFGLGEQTVSIPDITELLPGGEITITANVKDVLALFLNTTTVRVVPTGASDIGAVDASTGNARTFAPPITLLLLLLALLFMLLARRAYVRRRQADASDAQGDGATTNHPAGELEPQRS